MEEKIEKIEIVFNWDTTGSMYPVLNRVRKEIEEVITKLFKEIPNLRIGLGANGDYGDLAYSGYTTKYQNLTADIYNLVKFTRETNPTAGFGNGGEAYEQVLKESQTVFDWSMNSRKILVMIGDEIAHTPNWHENKGRVDWRVEAQKLRDAGVNIYTVQCLSRGREADNYYSELASIGNGYHLRLDQFNDIINLVNAIIYRQVSTERLDEYEQKIVSTGKMNRALDESFSTLSGRPRDAKGRFVSYLKENSNSDLLPVAPGRFQVFEVHEKTPIRQFAADNHLIFETGKGFYEFTKSETIQPYKEIVLREKVSGDTFTGKKARDMIGLPDNVDKTISPRTMLLDSSKYDVFIQSTSYTRNLTPNTQFLYEVDLNH